MRAVRTSLVCLTAALIVVPFAAPATSQTAEGLFSVVEAPKPLAIVAHIDTGVNPYAPAFRDRSALARRHPSTYISGYPKDAQALRLTLDKPYDEAFEADEDKWKLVKRGTLYWIPGTKIVGAISFGAGGTYCPPVSIPTGVALSDGTCSEHVILDDHGHGTMTGSRATGIPDSLAPDARLVTIEGLGAGSVEWAAQQGWIDVQTNSWVNIAPAPIPAGTSEAFYEASKKMVTLAASGNGAAYLGGVAPTPTYVLSTAPRGVILVGGHDNGRATLWSGAPPHVVADAYMGMAASARTNEPMHPEIMACCTSAASPYAAGGAAALILEARRILKDNSAGVVAGVLACGESDRVPQGPLKDGDLRLEELKEVFFHSAEPFPAEGKDDGAVHWTGGLRPPDQVEYGPGGNPYCPGCTTTPVPWSTLPAAAGDTAYPFLGYGGINERSVELGIDVLRGKAELPERAAADQQYEIDQVLRDAFFLGNSFDSTPTHGDCTSDGSVKELEPPN